ncbi:MAG: RecX family transcriptional regulator [Eubacterium sp.]|nr:RecX family transcriptional regulator [Eubacterium sp.]
MREVSQGSKKAIEKAMSLLLIKDRTSKELSDRLLTAGFSEDETRDAMEYVTSFGYVDDRRYVENFISFQRAKRSKKEIIYKLIQKGLKKDFVVEIMEEIDYSEDNMAIANLIKKRLKGEDINEISYQDKQKIFAYLARKGFEISRIKRVFSQIETGVL